MRSRRENPTSSWTETTAPAGWAAAPLARCRARTSSDCIDMGNPPPSGDVDQGATRALGNENHLRRPGGGRRDGGLGTSPAGKPGTVGAKPGGGSERAERAPDIALLVREVLGFEDLRAGQADAIRAGLAGRDVLAVMPTGSGKSAIYL